MNTLLALPIVIPLLCAAVSYLAHRHSGAQRAVALIGTGAMIGAAWALLRRVSSEGMVATQAGGWPVPVGITLAADRFSAALVLMTAVLGFATAIYSIGDIGRPRRRLHYYPVFFALFAGVGGALLTGDLFNLYVWFEVTLISSFVLVGLGGEEAQLRGALKYVVMNLVSSLIFLSAVGLLYGVAGTLNMADLAEKLPRAEGQEVVFAATLLLLASFGVKAALFPFHFWLPASYPAPPIAISALLAGLLTKTGVYAMIRVMTLMLPDRADGLRPLLLVIAGLTMMVGALGALAEKELRRVLACQVVAHMGFMIMGLAFFSTAGLAGAVFYMLHDMLVKTALFMSAGNIERARGTSNLDRLGGLAATRPGLACLFLIPALSLAGTPPLSGFFGKAALFKAGLEAGEWAVVAIGALASLLTLASMSLVWREAFWKAAPTAGQEEQGGSGEGAGGSRAWTRAGLAGLSGAILALTAAAGPVMSYCSRAAEQLLNREDYLRAVLGGGNP